MDSGEMAAINKSPGSSSHDPRAENEGPEEDMEAEENVENTTPGVCAIILIECFQSSFESVDKKCEISIY